MKSLRTLIKLRKKDLDEKRQELAELESQKQQLMHYFEQMNSELKVEEEFSANDPMMSITFDNYRKRIKERQGNINIAVEGIAVQSASMNNEIAVLYGEVKKFEIVLQNKISEQARELKSKETKMLDEVALGAYLRNEKAYSPLS